MPLKRLLQFELMAGPYQNVTPLLWQNWDHTLPNSVVPLQCAIHLWGPELPIMPGTLGPETKSWNQGPELSGATMIAHMTVVADLVRISGV